MGENEKMLTDEILERIASLLSKREKPSDRTLQRYAKAGVIPKSISGYRQGVPGFQADFPEETVAEYYASHLLMHELRWSVTMKELATVRKDALRLLNDTWTQESLADFVRLRWSYFPAIERWIIERNRILSGSRLDEQLGLRYDLDDDGRMLAQLVLGESAEHYGCLLDIRRQ